MRLSNAQLYSLGIMIASIFFVIIDFSREFNLGMFIASTTIFVLEFLIRD